MAFIANGKFISISLNDYTPFSTSSINNDPNLVGPDKLCNVFGSVIGSFFGAGNPATDVYSWKIFGPSNQLLFSGTGRAGFQTISYTFSIIGAHKIELSVSRGQIPIGSFSKGVEVVKGPDIVLNQNYTLCENQEIEIKAIDPGSSNFSNYIFEWKNEVGTVIGNQNTLNVNQEGKYEVVFYLKNNTGENECETKLSTQVTKFAEISIVSSSESVCVDQFITFSSQPSLFGKWEIQKNGSLERTSLGQGFNVSINPSVLSLTPDEYTIFFSIPNINNPTCLLEAQKSFVYYQQPNFEFLSPTASSGCQEANGSLKIKVLSPIDQLSIAGIPIGTGPFFPGDEIDIPGLKSGTYLVTGLLGICTNSLASIVPLDNPPDQLKFKISDIEPEKCTDTGKIDGSFTVVLENGPIIGFYRIINERGAVILDESTGTATEIKVEIQGGTYLFELYGSDNCTLPQLNQVIVPSLDQTIFNVSETISVCQSFDFSPLTNQALEFTITEPDGQVSTFKASESFQLTKEGKHEILGILPNQSDICPSTQEFNVILVDPVDFEPVLIQQDCFGNRTYLAEIYGRDPNSVNFTWYNEENKIVGNGQLLFPTSNGEFKLDVQPANSAACPIDPKSFEIKEPILSVDVTLSSTKLCEFGPRAILSLTTTDFDEVTDIEWRRFDESGQIEELPQFKGKTEIIADVEGIYEASVLSIIPAISKNCELGRSTIELDLTPQKVPFEVPVQLSICDPYFLVPQSTEALSYTLTYPDGTSQEKQGGEAFEISLPGTYTILGYNTDINYPICPDQKTFEVKINEPVQFAPTFVNQTCDGTYEYFATLSNYLPENVDFFWRDAAGNLLGTDQTLFLSQYGTFQLDVQPKGSIPCADTSLEFQAEVPVLATEIKIKSFPYCPDESNTRLELESSFETVTEIQWWFTEINGTRNQLTSETDKKEIIISQEGTYEVILLNRFNCQLGDDQVLVLKSQDQVRPQVNDIYQICPRYEIAETINPGSFASYEWYFGDNLVSINPTFKPSQIGEYQLSVYSSEGCLYQTSFLTEEECELKVIVPEAMIPGNTDKNFLAYTNYLVDDLEIWIFNKWGQIIFHCKNSNLISKESTCPWDGYFDGEKVPPGAYSYRMNFKNIEKNISQYQLGSILIID
jgi:hypothetical protein